VAWLLAGPLRAHLDRETGQLAPPLAADVLERQAEAARDRGAEHLGRHHARVPSTGVFGLVDGDLVGASRHARFVAPERPRGDLEPLRHGYGPGAAGTGRRGWPGWKRSARYARSWAAATASHECAATTPSPPARSRSRPPGSG